MEVNVPESRTEGGQQVIGRIVLDEQIRMTNIQMQTQLRDRLQQFSELPDTVEAAREVLDHQSYSQVARNRNQLANGFEVALDNELALVQGRLAVWMEIHPA